MVIALRMPFARGRSLCILFAGRCLRSLTRCKISSDHLNHGINIHICSFDAEHRVSLFTDCGFQTVQQHKSQFAELIEAARRSRLAAKTKLESSSDQPTAATGKTSDNAFVVDSDSDTKPDNSDEVTDDNIIATQRRSFFGLDSLDPDDAPSGKPKFMLCAS
jgi:hypothetical protein